MYKLFIKSFDENKKVFMATYLSENKEFEFSNQAADSQYTFTLTTNSEIELDCTACKEPTIGDRVHVSGTFINFYKKKPPLLTLCATNIMIF